MLHQVPTYLDITIEEAGFWIQRDERCPVILSKNLWFDDDENYIQDDYNNLNTESEKRISSGDEEFQGANKVKKWCLHVVFATLVITNAYIF